MIIECPSCSTRYDIKSGLPPEGRTVRCAKCGTVWRAIPDREREDAEEEDRFLSSRQTEATNDGHEARQAAYGRLARHDEERGQLWEKEPSAADGATIETAKPSAEEREEPDADGDEASADAGHAGKVSWFSSFRRRKRQGQAEPPEETAGNALAQAAAEPIPFPRSHSPLEQEAEEPAEERRAFEAARQAMRSVLSSLGHGRSAATAVLSEDPDKGVSRGPEAHRESEGAERLAEPLHLPKAGGAAAGDLSFLEAHRIRGGKGKDDRRFKTGEKDVGSLENKDEAGSDGDPDAALREAMRSHFLAHASPTQATPSPREDELAERLETHLKSAAAATEEAAGGGVARIWGKASPRANEEVFDSEAVDVEETAGAKDDDTAFDQRLYREIEETQEKSVDAARRKRRGGLALAAAWGLFVCVASGLIVGFFVFRDTIADAAPGLASLYRTLGMPVTVQPLVLESVRYEWSISDGRPVLTVSGSVFNRARRKVRLPQFLITIKDQDPALDRDYSANLRISGSKIRSNERADFDIELVSPNPTITAVELELRNVR